MKGKLFRSLLAISFSIMAVVTSFRLVDTPSEQVHAANYDNVGTPLVLPTAYYDALRNYGTANVEGDVTNNKKEALKANIKTILGNHFGNVGLLVGVRSSSSASNIETTVADTLALSVEDMSPGNQDPLIPLEISNQYYMFGRAIHALNDSGAGYTPDNVGISSSLSDIATGARGIMNFGVALVHKYNPAPVVQAFFDASVLNDGDLRENMLVQAINNSPMLKEFFNYMGKPMFSSVNVSFATLLLAMICTFLFIFGTLSYAFNRRTAGENYKKIIVKIFIAVIAIPIIANFMTWGVNTMHAIAFNDTDIESTDWLQNHLNFADWYATGFRVPDGVALEITKDGRFNLKPSDVRAINEYTYKEVKGKPGTAEQIKEYMESVADDNDNRTLVNYNKPSDWGTDAVFKAGEKLSLNDQSKLVELVDKGKEHFVSHSNVMTADGNGGYKVSSNGTSSKGIGPIQANNLMQSQFDNTGIKAGSLTNQKYMSTVVFYASNGAVTPGSSGYSVNPVLNFFATFTMIWAAIQVTAKVFSAGLGGVLGGGARSMIGSTAGFAQALGGVIALTFGILGISIIMNITIESMGFLQHIAGGLIAPSGADSALEPIREMIKEACGSGFPLNIIGSIFSSIVINFVSFILTLVMFFILPKFGGIPIKAYGEWLCRIPQMFAERGQHFENRFTGDYRAGHFGGGRGGGGGSSTIGALATQAIKEGTANAKQATIGGLAAGGYLMGKAGGALENRYKPDTGDSASGAAAAAQSMVQGDTVNNTDVTNDNDTLSDNNTESSTMQTTNSVDDRDTLSETNTTENSQNESLSESSSMSDKDSVSESSTSSQSQTLLSSQAKTLSSSQTSMLSKNSQVNSTQAAKPTSLAGKQGSSLASGASKVAAGVGIGASASKVGNLQTGAPTSVNKMGTSSLAKPSGLGATKTNVKTQGLQPPKPAGLKATASALGTRAKQTAKYAVSKEARHKTLHAVGKGMRVASGGISGQTAAKGMLHVFTSMAGKGHWTENMVRQNLTRDTGRNFAKQQGQFAQGGLPKPPGRQNNEMSRNERVQRRENAIQMFEEDMQNKE